MVRISVCLRFAPSGSPTLRFPLSPLSTFPGTHPLPFFRKDVIPKDLSARVCKSCDSKGVTEKASQSCSRSLCLSLSAARRQAPPARLACPARSRREQCRREPSRSAALSLHRYFITSLLQPLRDNLHALRSPHPHCRLFPEPLSLVAPLSLLSATDQSPANLVLSTRCRHFPSSIGVPPFNLITEDQNGTTSHATHRNSRSHTRCGNHSSLPQPQTQRCPLSPSHPGPRRWPLFRPCRSCT